MIDCLSSLISLFWLYVLSPTFSPASADLVAEFMICLPYAVGYHLSEERDGGKLMESPWEEDLNVEIYYLK